MTVKECIEFLQTMPQDRELLCLGEHNYIMIAQPPIKNLKPAIRILCGANLHGFDMCITYSDEIIV
jgi:hypothetical protein